MSANLSVKDISEKKTDSTSVEELLVERYESLYFSIYLKIAGYFKGIDL